MDKSVVKPGAESFTEKVLLVTYSAGASPHLTDGASDRWSLITAASVKNPSSRLTSGGYGRIFNWGASLCGPLAVTEPSARAQP
jgi:hypothetical protein